MRTFLSLAPAALAYLASQGRARRTALMLHQLSDVELKDIGISRADIGRVARGEVTTRFS